MNSTVSISTDGNCGSNSETNATCLHSTFGNCCSSKGYCGGTLDYCTTGCQLEFGECSDGSEQTISTTGDCGSSATSNVTCLGSSYGDCCSRKGYCGGTASYCGSGCQGLFGRCGVNETSSSTTSATVLPSSSAIASSSSTPSSLPIEDINSNSLSKGAIAGISVGSVIGGLAIISLLVWLFFRRRKPVADETKVPIDYMYAARHEMGGAEVKITQTHEMEAKTPGETPVELPGHGH